MNALYFGNPKARNHFGKLILFVDVKGTSKIDLMMLFILLFCDMLSLTVKYILILMHQKYNLKK